jgi:hypothetical protein
MESRPASPPTASTWRCRPTGGTWRCPACAPSSRTSAAARRGCHQLEIYFGPFERTFPIPPDVEIDRDAISATLKDGFLTIHLPRRVRQPQVSRSIPIEREP